MRRIQKGVICNLLVHYNLLLKSFGYVGCWPPAPQGVFLCATFRDMGYESGFVALENNGGAAAKPACAKGSAGLTVCPLSNS